MPNLRRVGQVAEDRAADYLLGLGYTIVTRRFSTRHGEIDIIALDGETLVVVEVKQRSAPGFVPEEGVTASKKKSLSSVVNTYLHQMEDAERDVRYDLVAIDKDGLRHHIDAWCPDF